MLPAAPGMTGAGCFAVFAVFCSRISALATSWSAETLGRRRAGARENSEASGVLPLFLAVSLKNSETGAATSSEHRSAGSSARKDIPTAGICQVNNIKSAPPESLAPATELARVGWGEARRD